MRKKKIGSRLLILSLILGGFSIQQNIAVDEEQQAPDIRITVETIGNGYKGKNVFYEKIIRFTSLSEDATLEEYLREGVMIYFEGEQIAVSKETPLRQEGNYRIDLVKTYDVQEREIIIEWDEKITEFEIDRTSPHIKTNIDKKSEYIQKEKKIEISVEDKNFEPERSEAFIFTINGRKKIAFSDWEQEEGVHKAIVTCEEEGEYDSIVIVAKDSAGNITRRQEALHFTIDRSRPNGSIQMEGAAEKWSDFSEKEEVYCNKEEKIVINARDKFSGIQEIYYSIQDEKLTEEELQGILWNPYKTPFDLPVNQKCIVYARLMDRAENVIYLSSPWIMLDRKLPEIVIQEKDRPECGIYKEDAELVITIQDEIIQKSFSDIKEAYYEMTAESGEKTTLNKRGKLSSGVNQIRIKKIDNSAIDVKIKVVAEDRAGNISLKRYKVSMDAQSPEISVSFSEEQPKNQKYFNQKRLVKVHITESNFYQEGVVIKQNGVICENISWQMSRADGDRKFTTIIEINQSGAFRLEVQAVDRVGNESEVKRVKPFLVDLKNPHAKLELSGRKMAYRNVPIKIQLTVVEENFSEKEASEGLYILCNRKRVVPELKWDHEGNIHKASYFIEGDGEYRIHFSYVDLSGRKSNRIAEKRFYLDQKAPLIQIQGISKILNQGKIHPKIQIKDKNLAKDRIKIIIAGSKTGVQPVHTKSNQKGSVVAFCDTMNNEKKSDDCYTIHVWAYDLAGNQSKSKKMFWINRNGSVFSIDGNEQVMQRKYLRELRKDIILYEENVTLLKSGQGHLLISRDGERIKNIKLKCKKMNKGGWNRYQYIVSAKNFKEEGVYRLQTESEDIAGNYNNALKKKKGVSFVIDRTKPQIFLSDMKEKSQYYKKQHIVRLKVTDNVEVASVSVYVDGREAELESLGQEYCFRLNESSQSQEVHVVCKDYAGNSKEVRYREVLVTTSKWIKIVQKGKESAGFAIPILAIFLVRAGRRVFHRRSI